MKGGHTGIDVSICILFEWCLCNQISGCHRSETLSCCWSGHWPEGSHGWNRFPLVGLGTEHFSTVQVFVAIMAANCIQHPCKIASIIMQTSTLVNVFMFCEYVCECVCVVCMYACMCTCACVCLHVHLCVVCRYVHVCVNPSMLFSCIEIQYCQKV